MTECFDRVKTQQKSEGYIKVEQGFATILLPGNDVPFHSQYLWSSVKAYFLAIS
jgi:fatty acid synthase subunit beta